MNPLLSRLLVVVVSGLAMTLSGQTAITIPGLEVPITWQSMLVIVLPLVLPKWEACLGIALFLIAGALGAPVFANGYGGFDVYLSPSGGYLIGFLLMAIAVALLKPGLTRHHPLRPMWLFPTLHLGLSVFGMLWIQVMGYGDISLGKHFLPYLVGIIIKSFMAWGIFVVTRILLSEYRKSNK